MNEASQCDKTPLISVIVPVYKVEKYLNRCVDSLLAQTYQNLEIILVDDGSPDRCPEICDRYAQEDKRVRVIHKENGGLSDARNAGIDAATGEYLAFVDSDDYVDAGLYAALMRALLQSGDRLALCGFQKVTDEGGLIKKTPMRFPARLSEDEFWYQLFFPYRDLGTVAWNKLYHKSLFEDLRFPKGAIHEDEWLVHHYVSRAGQVSVVNECLYFYVVRGGSITAQPLSPRSLSILEAFSQRLAYFAEKGKARAVTLGMRNYARYVVFFLDDWRGRKELTKEKSKVRTDFLLEIARYLGFAGKADRAYWFAALNCPMLLRRVIRLKEKRARKRAQST